VGVAAMTAAEKLEQKRDAVTRTRRRRLRR